jgi:hypothetical protein
MYILSDLSPNVLYIIFSDAGHELMGQQERNSQKIIPRLQGSIDNVL